MTRCTFDPPYLLERGAAEHAADDLADCCRGRLELEPRSGTGGRRHLRSMVAPGTEDRL